VKTTRVFSVVACAMLLSRSSYATGLTDFGDDIAKSSDARFGWSGYVRGRAEALYNLDLDRGPLPSGRAIFPVSESNSKTQWLSHADMRFRSDLAAYAPGGLVAAKIRADILDNIALGSMPDGVPYASLTQRPGSAALTIRRAYGEVLLPFGFLSFGRMGSHWGLGSFTNGGDCIDCDSGDSSDRIAFVTPLFGHAFAFAYDFSATLATVARPNNRVVSIEPSAAVRSFTFAAMKYAGEDARARRTKAGKATLEYGVYAAYRYQKDDIPSAYIESDRPAAFSGAQVIGRDYSALASNLWLKVTHPYVRLEGEATLIAANVGQPSLVPGLLLRDPIKTLALGIAFESEFGKLDGAIKGGIDAGYASGDKEAVLGAVPIPPKNNRVDTFRFHPDYRVDRILFREILGAVTNAIYVRPHGRARIYKSTSGELAFDLAGVMSFAAAAGSGPSGKTPLGVEIDPSLTYQSPDGFFVAADYGLLFPLSGLDNPARNLTAKPAQSLRARIALKF
jgi:uncharacterized protein (TIGR04551 family)